MIHRVLDSRQAAASEPPGFSTSCIDKLTGAPSLREMRGVVYTKSWVVDLILDLVGYRSSADLAELVAVEPAAGDGAFLIPMIERLLKSLERHGRPLADGIRAISAYEVDGAAAERTINLAANLLAEQGASKNLAREIASGWVTVGDYLLTTPAKEKVDIVVGNPPYIRYDDLPKTACDQYQRLFPTMRGRCDIYIGFIEAGLRQLKDGGVLGFICADRWMRSAYGARLRQLVSDSCGVETVIEMHNAPAFEEEVAAYPAVVIIRKGPQGSVLISTADARTGPLLDGRNLADSVVALATRDATGVRGFKAKKLDRWFVGSGAWPWLEPDKLELLQHLEGRFQPLEDASSGTKVGIGVATGADKVYLTRDSNVCEPDRLLPLATTADTKSGTLQWSGIYLVNPWLEDRSLVDLARYPKLRKYLESQRKILELRNIARRNSTTWFRTIDKVDPALTGRPKLYFPDMKLASHPVLDNGSTYPHHNLYYLVSDAWDLEVLGGLLLSRVAQLFIEAYCVKMRGGTLRFQAQYLRKIRLPDRLSVPPNICQELRASFRVRDSQAATQAAIKAYGISREHEGLLLDS